MQQTDNKPPEYFGTQLLDLVSNIVPVTCSCLYLVDNDTSMHDFVCKDLPTNTVDAYEEYYYQKDPFHPLNRKQHEPIAMLEDLMTNQQLNSCEYHNDFLPSFGMHHEAEIYLRNNDERIIGGIAIMRNAEERPFLKNELKKLNEIIPFMELALRAYTNPSFKYQSHLPATFDLTKREIEVARLLSEGKSNKEISNLLFISPLTTKSHIQNLFRKTNVSSRTALIASLFGR